MAEVSITAINEMINNLSQIANALERIARVLEASEHQPIKATLDSPSHPQATGR